MYRSASAILVAVSSLIFASIAPDADASCSAIPQEFFAYPSEKGSVSRALAEPGGVVDITLNPLCDCEPAGPCDLTAAEKAEVIFVAGATPETVVGASIVSKSTHRIRITIPNTKNVFSAPAGLAGPAKIVVTGGGETLAEISTLYQPTSSCDQEPGAIFGHFVALPEPTSIDENPGKMVATFDAEGRLLIPLEHADLPVSPDGSAIAHYERGGGWTLVRGALASAKQNQEPAIRAFDLNGQPLPPLLAIDDAGGLFGTADAKTSVLQVLRPKLKGKKIWKRLRLTQKPKHRGAVRLKDADLGYEWQGCFPTIIDAARVTDEALAFARDERVDQEKHNSDQDETDRVVFVNATGIAASDCGESSRIAVAESGNPPMRLPESVAGGMWTALLQDELADQKDVDGDGQQNARFVRIFDSNGEDITASPPASTPIDVKAAISHDSAILGGESLAVEEPLVYFLDDSSDPTLRVIDAENSVLRSLAPAVSAVATGPEFAVWTGKSDALAILYDAGEDDEHVLSTTAHRLAIGDELLALAGPVSGGTANTLHYLELPDSGDAPPPLTTAATTAAELAVDGNWVVFLTDEAAAIPTTTATSGIPADLNGDGDQTDRVLRAFTPGGALEPIEQAAVEFVVGDDLIAFRTLESDQAGGKTPPSNSEDSDSTDHILQVYDLGTKQLWSTGQAATGTTLPGWKRMAPYAVVDRSIFFFTEEAEQNADLNRDGDMTDTVFRVFHVDSQSTVPHLFSSASNSLLAPIPPARAVFEGLGAESMVRLVSTEPRKVVESRVSGDFDGDGVYDAVDLCIGSPDPRQTDVDCDQLGEGVGDLFPGRGCDATLCTTFAPDSRSMPRIADRCASEVATAGRRYLEARVDAVSSCLQRLLEGRSRGRSENADAECRGYFVEGTEVFPHDRDTAKALRLASESFDERFDAACGKNASPTLDHAAQTVRRVHAETANAVTWVAFGSVDVGSEKNRAFDPPAHECQTAISGLIRGPDLGRLLAGATECLQEPSENPGPCVANIIDGVVTLPAYFNDPGTRPFAHWQAALRKSCQRNAAAPLAACADTPEGLASCLSCAITRRTGEAILSLALLQKDGANRLARAKSGSELGLTCGLP